MRKIDSFTREGGTRGRSNTLYVNAYRTNKKETNSSSFSTYKALANEDFLIELAYVAGSHMQISSKVASNAQVIPSKKKFSQMAQQECPIITKKF